MGHTVSSKSIYFGQLSERIASELNVSQLRVKQILDKEIELMKEILLNGQNVAIKNFIQLKPIVKSGKTYYKGVDNTKYVKSSEGSIKIEKPSYLWVKLEVSDCFSTRLKEKEIPKLAYENIASLSIKKH